jgi:exonuclease SbcC
MRPLKLELEGFTAYKNKTVVSFEGLQRVVLTGPNGSGKSSLLDGMIFALFGTTPRMRGKQSKEFISQGRDSFRIALEFEVEGKRYRVQRRYFKKGQPQVRLETYYLDRWQVLTEKVEETNKAITDLLHMSYDTFTKAVVLPQNLFDQFLKGDKEKRRQVLEEMLSLEFYEKIAGLAGEKSRALREQIRILEENFEEKSRFASIENVQSLQKRLSQLEAEVPRLIEERRKLQELSQKKKSLEDLRKQIVDKEKELDTLDLHLKKIENKKMDLLKSDSLPKFQKRLSELQALSGVVSFYEKQKDEAEQRKKQKAEREIQLKQCEEKQRNLMQEIEKIKANLEGLSKEEAKLQKEIERFNLFSAHLEELSRLKILQEEREKSEALLSKLKQEKEKTKSDLAELDKTIEKKAFHLKEKEEENERLRMAWLVYELQGKLSPGGFCLVCNQPVLALPKPVKPEVFVEDLSQLKKEYEALLAKQGAKQQVFLCLEHDCLEQEAELEKDRNEEIRLIKNLSKVLGISEDDFLQEARGEYKKLQSAPKKLEEFQRKEKEFSRLLQEKEIEKQKLEGDAKLFSHEIQTLEESLKSLNETLVELEARMKENGIPVFSESYISGEIKSLNNKISAHQKEKEDLDKEFHQTQARRELVLFELEKNKNEEIKLISDLNIVGKETIDFLEEKLKKVEDALAELQTEIGRTRQQLENLQKAKEEAEALSKKLEKLKNEEKIFSTLQQDLQKNRLPDFLLSSVLGLILESASEKFFELSGGRYRFDLEGSDEILVLDSWNAGEPRPVTGLSGGESFAASLSVALALSEYLQGRQEIQCLFIDEGFGNLDRDTRDKVSEILTSLKTEKLIGIVTHLEDLAELFPERIVVQKLPEGSRVVQIKAEDSFFSPLGSNDLITMATAI